MLAPPHVPIEIILSMRFTLCKLNYVILQSKNRRGAPVLVPYLFHPPVAGKVCSYTMPQVMHSATECPSVAAVAAV